MEKEPKAPERGGMIALVGNPNVGKSTLFNALTHLHQHTGNWPGKTVSSAQGTYEHKGRTYTLVDLPGTYSLEPDSAEEAVTRDFLDSGAYDAVVVVADATCLARSLALGIQVMETAWPVVIAVNLMDEAEKKELAPDLSLLREKLGCPVVGTSARRGQGLAHLKEAVEDVFDSPPPRPSLSPCFCCGEPCRRAALMNRAEAIARECAPAPEEKTHRRDRRLDRILASGGTGFAAMLILLGLVLWLTVRGAQIPSRLLSELLFSFHGPLRRFLQSTGAPWWFTGLVADGLYRTVAWVVSVMLPPMAIFFPLFTLLEDAGYLPRVAFNLDRFFALCGAHGRQSLTMCMGLGCNACGVTGCRIIQSPRERLVAILTNTLIPCNGRFPTLVALISVFFAADGRVGGSLAAAGFLLGCIVLATVVTLLSSRLLTATVLRGEPSSFSLELPPYRIPSVSQVLIRSLLDRTLFVLGRAVTVAAPAGAIIWCAANITVGGTSILSLLAGALDPVGRIMGMDGMILVAFLLAFPANEIMLPCALMGYLSTGLLTSYETTRELGVILFNNGWTPLTALSVLIFTLFHFPCGTTVLTIHRETGSIRWTLLSILLPTAVGVALCILITLAAGLL